MKKKWLRTQVQRFLRSGRSDSHGPDEFSPTEEASPGDRKREYQYLLEQEAQWLGRRKSTGLAEITADAFTRGENAPEPIRPEAGDFASWARSLEHQTRPHRPPDISTIDLTRVAVLLLDPEDFEQTARAEIATSGPRSKTDRARSAAIAFVDRQELPPRAVDIVGQIFEANGWSRTKTSLEDLVERQGATIEEIYLVWRLRALWSESEGFWIATDAGREYPSLTWRLALQIVRSFSQLPSLAEIEVVLLEALDEWKPSPRLPSFRAFIQAAVSLADDWNYAELPTLVRFISRSEQGAELSSDRFSREAVRALRSLGIRATVPSRSLPQKEIYWDSRSGYWKPLIAREVPTSIPNPKEDLDETD